MAATYLRALLQSVRPHQWSKNLLLFVPALTAHRLGDPATMWALGQAFVAFSLAASALYLVNDLCDREADQAHPVKRKRPVASGALPTWVALPSAVAALGLAAVVAWSLPTSYGLMLSGYAVLSAWYSWRLKRLAIVDVLCLAALYTSRILAGQVATGIGYTPWLTAFSLFFFFGLGLLKRVSELRNLREQPVGRGYSHDDLPILEMLGVSSNVVAILVLALYIDSGAETLRLYHYPELLWLVCPILFFWVGRAWLLAHRGQMHDDPVLYALTDRGSLSVALVLAAVLTLASRGLPGQP